jgi:hypothetical protein
MLEFQDENGRSADMQLVKQTYAARFSQLWIDGDDISFSDSAGHFTVKISQWSSTVKPIRLFYGGSCSTRGAWLLGRAMT